MAKKSYFRAVTVLAGMLAAAVVATLMTAVPAWAASNVFVSDVGPDGGATSVATDSNITAKFSKAMRASTIKGTTFYLKKQGSSTTIPATVSYSRTSKTATLDPASILDAGATYTATIKGGKLGVIASDGGKLGGTRDSTANFANGKVTWSFTVATPPPSDTTRPRVSSVVPSEAATNVTRNADVTATFSEDMKSGTVTNQSFTLSKSGTPVATQVTYDEDSLTATLDPDQDLEAGTTYEARIAASVEDLAGNALVEEETWSFTTVFDPDDPTSVTVTPNPLHFSADDISPWCNRVAKNLTVTNNGPNDVTFADVSITGADAGNFSENLKPFLAQQPNHSATLLAGDHFIDPVTFSPGPTPQDRQMSYSATLTFEDQNGAAIGNSVQLTATTACLNVG